MPSLESLFFALQKTDASIFFSALSPGLFIKSINDACCFFSRSLDIWVIHYVEVYLEVMQEN